MPSNYVGDPTATESPSAPPNPPDLTGAPVYPTAALVADGDNRNAASMVQWGKVYGDFIAWLMRGAQAKASDWGAAVQVFRNALGHRRGGFDHMGFPAGQIQSWQEDWATGDNITTAGGTPTRVPNLPKWDTFIANSSSTGSIFIGNLVSPYVATSVTLEVADGNNDFAGIMSAVPQCYFLDTKQIALEFVLLQQSATNPNVINTHGLVTTLGATPGASTGFAWFHKLPSGNWFAQTRDGSTTTSVDTSVAGTTSPQRFRIEWHGATVGDDSTARAVFLIDGAVVANITTHLPSADSPPSCSVIFALQNNGSGIGSGSKCDVLPVRFSVNVYGTDVFQ